MTYSSDAELRLKSDDFMISSVISANDGFHEHGLKARRSPWLALATALVLAGCQAETAPVADATRPVQVQRVAFNSDGTTRDFVGVVRARYETDLGFRVGGKVIARVVNVGDRVHIGDVIARLDPQDLRWQLDTAEAEHAAATSHRTQAAADYERYTILKERGTAAIAQFDQKKTANDEAEGRLARAQRALHLARNQLAYAELRADAEGVITATLAEPGQVVAMGQPVARLAHRGEKEAVVALPEPWLAEARQAWASVRLWSDRDRSFAAQLRELSPQADPTTRTYAARFTILGTDDSVALGMTATVTMERAGEAPVAKLPLSAVLNRGNGPSVYVVDASDTLELQPVTVAAFNGDAALVTSGVKDGDRVVTLGVQKLQSGRKVRAVEAQP
jgi:RND family efflux transporter MFP subunit